MAKTFSIQHNVIDSKQYKKLSTSSKALYLTLCQLSNRYGNKTNDNWFDRSIRQLQDDTGLSDKTITKARKELEDYKMIQVTIEPDYTAHIPIQYRIVTWERPRRKYKNYRKNSGSNYRKKYDSSKENTKVIKVLASDNLYKTK